MLHYPVLLNESITLLDLKKNGLYLDGTFGRGGHCKEILAAIGANGKVIAFDKDMEAINYATANFTDTRLTMIHDSFCNFENYVELNAQFDGIILDLGISSPQIDDKSRGFSYNAEAELDMRMDNTKGPSAKDWINTASEEQIADVLWRYGEERFSRRIAKNIIKERNKNEIKTTKQLADIIKFSVLRNEKGQNPATRSFQAIRIFVNNELGDLEKFLNKIPSYLKVGGRVVVISFHSLEDRIVKNHFNQLIKGQSLPKWVNQKSEEVKYKLIAKKIRPSLGEIEENVRSRSAILRCLEKISE
jgi:16S rRNA (cytosine1402-N4)-methyltransferase